MKEPKPYKLVRFWHKKFEKGFNLIHNIFLPMYIMLTKPRIKPVKLTKREKALLSILIKEIKDVLPNGKEKVEELLDSWIKANNLPIDKVSTLTQEEFYRWIRS
jgi:hypothetical protein